MAKVTKEAVGQYNYVVADLATDSKRFNNQDTSHYDIAKDASIELVVKHPRQIQLIKIEPPKLYETNYHSDFQPPPKKNLVYDKSSHKVMYTAYGRSKLNSASAAVTRPNKEDAASKTKHFNEDFVGNKNKILKSLLERSKLTNMPRAKTAEPAIYHSAPKRRGKSKKEIATTAFERAIIQGKPDWKHEKETSYDILKPEKPDPIRKTRPYGSKMENMQEMITQKYMDEDDDDDTLRSCSSMSLASRLQTGESHPQTYSNFPSRASSRRSKTTSTNNVPHSSTPYVPTDNQLAVILEEEDDSTEQRLFTRKSSDQVELRLSKKDFDHLDMGRIQKAKKNKQLNLYKRKVPDKRFYRSKIRQTPNEMSQYQKMRNRTFFKPLEQAIHEKDFTDQEVKYAPERQLVKDAKWRIRQDLKDTRTNNINSLVDRFEQRAQLKKQEKSQRTGFPKYLGDPVNLYRTKDFEVRKQVVAPRRRITPSIGSVQRARNLSNYANIWNQPAAQPNWGPQKVDHNLFLPPVAMPN